jgi:hypothetical protein
MYFVPVGLLKLSSVDWLYVYCRLSFMHAFFLSLQANIHFVRMKEANMRASEKMLEIRLIFYYITILKNNINKKYM